MSDLSGKSHKKIATVCHLFVDWLALKLMQSYQLLFSTKHPYHHRATHAIAVNKKIVVTGE